MKNNLKKRAIAYRKRGYSYSEILKEMPIAKSTLSLWLRTVGLSRQQIHRLTEKKNSAIKKGWMGWQKKRQDLAEATKINASKEIGKLSKRAIWLIGIALYWAEGSKEKKNRPGQSVIFSNSDPNMIRFFLRWLKNVIKITDNDIKYEIYTHINSKDRIHEFNN